jgi:hypothetical protein
MAQIMQMGRASHLDLGDKCPTILVMAGPRPKAVLAFRQMGALRLGLPSTLLLGQCRSVDHRVKPGDDGKGGLRNDGENV